MELITLNDGTEVVGHCILTDDSLFVYLDGKSILEGVMLFGEPSRTIRIVEMNHGVEHVYEGYTDIYSVSHEYGNCNLQIRKV